MAIIFLERRIAAYVIKLIHTSYVSLKNNKYNTYKNHLSVLNYINYTTGSYLACTLLIGISS